MNNPHLIAGLDFEQLKLAFEEQVKLHNCPAKNDSALIAQYHERETALRLLEQIASLLDNHPEIHTLFFEEQTQQDKQQLTMTYRMGNWWETIDQDEATPSKQDQANLLRSINDTLGEDQPWDISREWILGLALQRTPNSRYDYFIEPGMIVERVRGIVQEEAWLATQAHLDAGALDGNTAPVAHMRSRRSL